MALNNRIYKYSCNTCNRNIERLADPARPDPLRCVITDQCTGKLSLVSTRFGLRPTNTPTVVGLLDRIKRGDSRVTEQVNQPLDSVNLSSFAASGGMTLALLTSSILGAERIYTVLDSDGNSRIMERTYQAALVPTLTKITAILFELTPQTLEYKRYTYNRQDRCVYVQGRDDSASQSPLAFDNTSNVRVSVNGSLLAIDKYDKTVSGTITFTPELSEPSMTIEVFVYKSLTQFFSEDKAIKLDFNALPQSSVLRTSAAWGDTASVGPYSPLFCSSISALDASRAYGLVRFEALDENEVPFIVDPSDGYFLLASPPYAFEDKRLTAIVPVTSFTEEGFPLNFTVNGETGDLNPVSDGEVLVPLARPLITSHVDSVSRSSNTVDLLVSRREKTFIIGPT